uniref:Uncharacterized protein n=1 Tax=Arundo donax TaxID=35708 RepID=A0A0A9B5X2_ARUDO
MLVSMFLPMCIEVARINSDVASIVLICKPFVTHQGK